ncbi:16S rRNA (adenine(1518)-N(6)/adenine(1519)-N(6))-dimethyltransferase RsmA [Bacteroidota bacterium]
MIRVRPKKSLGQHFLKEQTIAERIVAEISGFDVNKILEVGPGLGVLTSLLIKNNKFETFVIEIDVDLAEIIRKKYSTISDKVIEGDFLKFNIQEFFNQHIGLIGNFPYNISSQILFRVLEYKDNVDVVVGMFQKEVAERICSGHGSKKYGILSVLIQAYYDVEYLFTVDEQSFDPPPKVKSSVIRLIRNDVDKLACNEKLFKRVIKTGFNQRRKILRNSLKSICNELPQGFEIFMKRPEQLSVEEFIELTNLIEEYI